GSGSGGSGASPQGPTSGAGGSGGVGGDFGSNGSGFMNDLTIAPTNPVLTYKGQMLTQQFDCVRKGKKLNANWTVDNVALGTVSSSGLFTASGKLGGKTKITCQVGNDAASTNVTVNVVIQENPGMVSNFDIGLLQQGGKDPSFTWLYPYDAT